MLGFWGESNEMIYPNDLCNLWCLIQMCDGRGIHQESYYQKVLSIAECRTGGIGPTILNIEVFDVFSCVLFTEVQMRERQLSLRSN